MHTLVSHIKKERPRADSGVEAAVGITKERIPTSCNVPDAGGEVKEGVLPFRRVEVGIAPVWRRDDCLRFW